jgi:hypothetical protein
MDELLWRVCVLACGAAAGVGEGGSGWARKRREKSGTGCDALNCLLCVRGTPLKLEARITRLHA